MNIELFDYDLPESYIAQYPLKKRDHSKLMIFDRSSGRIINDVLRSTGARIECFVLEKKGKFDFEVLLRPSKRLKIKDIVDIDGYFFEVISKFKYGRALVRFNKPAENIFDECGVIPIPPYIKAEDFNKDLYQTVYARREGSTASPTAGLHFTEKMIEGLKEKGIRFASLVLHIGPGTFRPVSSEKVEDHTMHREYYIIDESQARMIREAKYSGNRVIAVGTTSSRVLETLMKEYGTIKGSSGYTDIYIYPPYKFRAVDCMITNFHLPRSTLLIMVSAFAGRENIMKAYSEAIKLNYRFYSFGDCMFII